MSSVRFLTLSERDSMDKKPCMIFLYCIQNHDKHEMESICDRFVASKCCWFTAVGQEHEKWHAAFDDADVRNNPDNEELWAVTDSTMALDQDTIQFWLDNITGMSKKIETVYFIGDDGDSLQFLIGEILAHYKSYESLYEWLVFPEIMLGLGFEMDCDHGFEEHKAHCGLILNKAHSERQKRRNDLYVLEHAERQIIGNHLFSQWRYFTHWAMAPANIYDMDYLHRVIDILNTK